MIVWRPPGAGNEYFSHLHLHDQAFHNLQITMASGGWAERIQIYCTWVYSSSSPNQHSTLLNDQMKEILCILFISYHSWIINFFRCQKFSTSIYLLLMRVLMILNAFLD